MLWPPNVSWMSEYYLGLIFAILLDSTKQRKKNIGKSERLSGSSGILRHQAYLCDRPGEVNPSLVFLYAHQPLPLPSFLFLPINHPWIDHYYDWRHAYAYTVGSVS